MTLRLDVEQLGTQALVEMFVLDTTFAGGTDIIRWHPGTTVADQPIVWQGNTYEPMPVEATGFEANAAGTLPRPKIKVSNIGGFIGAYFRQFDDLLGARVYRIRTFGKYLDAVNFPAGNPSADPTQEFPREVFIIARKATENPVFIEVELTAPFDAAGVLLPRRQVLAAACMWIYRDPATCGYAGGAVHNDPVYPGVDRCGKTIPACMLRFGSGILPTSAMPGSLVSRNV